MKAETREDGCYRGQAFFDVKCSFFYFKICDAKEVCRFALFSFIFQSTTHFFLDKRC